MSSVPARSPFVLVGLTRKAANTATINSSSGNASINEMVEMTREVSMSSSGPGRWQILEPSSHAQDEPTPATLTLAVLDSTQSARFSNVPHVPSSCEVFHGIVQVPHCVDNGRRSLKKWFLNTLFYGDVPKLLGPTCGISSVEVLETPDSRTGMLLSRSIHAVVKLVQPFCSRQGST